MVVDRKGNICASEAEITMPCIVAARAACRGGYLRESFLGAIAEEVGLEIELPQGGTVRHVRDYQRDISTLICKDDWRLPSRR